MFRTLADFQKSWEYETECTLKLLRALTDASLQQAVTPHDRTLGRIAWHIVTSIPEMMERTGLKLSGPPTTRPCRPRPAPWLPPTRRWPSRWPSSSGSSGPTRP